MDQVTRTAIYESGTANTPNAQVAITSSSQTVLAANPNRTQAWVSNVSNYANAYISLGGTAADDSGVMLTPGQTWTTDKYTGAINVYGELLPTWITSIVGNGTTATATCALPITNLESGDTIAISGSSISGFNSGYPVATQTGTYTFTFPSATSGTATGAKYYNANDGYVGVMEI